MLFQKKIMLICAIWWACGVHFQIKIAQVSLKTILLLNIYLCLLAISAKLILYLLEYSVLQLQNFKCDPCFSNFGRNFKEIDRNFRNMTATFIKRFQRLRN